MLYNVGMTRKENIKAQIAYWDKEAADLTAAMNARVNGAVSASVSAGGGSKSYTNYGISDFKKAIANAQLQARLWRAQLTGIDPRLPRHVAIVRS